MAERLLGWLPQSRWQKSLGGNCRLHLEVLVESFVTLVASFWRDTGSRDSYQSIVGRAVAWYSAHVQRRIAHMHGMIQLALKKKRLGFGAPQDDDSGHL